MFCAVALFLTSAWSRSTPLLAFKEGLAAYRGQTPLVLGGRDGFSGEESYHRRNYVLLCLTYDRSIRRVFLVLVAALREG